MKIAVTGGSGFLAQYVIRLLNPIEDYQVVSIGRTDINDSIFDIEHRVTDYTVSSLKGVLSEIDCVVHLAAKRGGKGHIDQFQENAIITQNLYEACHEKNISNIVYASSISVYSDDEPLPWIETQVTKPVNIYGISKLSGELIGDIYTREYGMKVKNLRFAHLFGCNEPNDYMINKFMRQAFNKEELVLYSKDNIKREFLYTKDAALAILCSIKKEESSGSFNIGSGEKLTNYEVAVAINRAFQNEGNLYIKSNEVSTKHCSFMKKLKSEEELEFLPKYSFEEAMIDIYKEMKGGKPL